MFEKVVLKEQYPPPFLESSTLEYVYGSCTTKNLRQAVQDGKKIMTVASMEGDYADDPYKIVLDDFPYASYYPEHFDVLATYLLHPHLFDDDWTWHLKTGQILGCHKNDSQYELVDVIIDRKNAVSKNDVLFVLRNIKSNLFVHRTTDELNANYFLIENNDYYDDDNCSDEIVLIPLQTVCTRDTKPTFHNFFGAYEEDFDDKNLSYSASNRNIDRSTTCGPVPSYIDTDGTYLYAFRVDPLATAKLSANDFKPNKAFNWGIGTKLYADEISYTVIDVFFDYRCVVNEKGGIAFILENENLDNEFCTLEDMQKFTDTHKKITRKLSIDEAYDTHIVPNTEIIEITDTNMIEITDTDIVTDTITNVEEKTQMKTTIEMNKIIGLLNNYIVKDENIGVSLNGLSIDNRVWNEKEQTFYQVDDTTWKGITAGFKVPTDVKHIKKGDIIFTSKNKPLVVREILTNTIKAQCPIEETVVEVIPSKAMLGYKAYDLLVTPFNFQNTINPIANLCVASAFAFHKGGTDEVVDVLLPQALPLLTCKADIGSIIQSSNFKWIAPALLIALEIFKDKTIDFKNTSKIKDWCREHKKETWLIVLAILTLLYLNKDKIANELIKERITTIPIIGAFAEPIGKLLLKMPKIQNKLIAKFNKTE